MAIDYKSEIYGAIVAALRANANVVTAFPAGNIHDDRTGGPARRRLASRAAQDFPSLDLEITSGDESSSRTPHFGMTGAAVVVTDAIVPVSVVLRLRMNFRTEKQDQQTSAERYVRQALHAGYPKLGLRYVHDFAIREMRTPSDQNMKEPGITQVDLNVAVTCRMHLSQLRD